MCHRTGGCGSRHRTLGLPLRPGTCSRTLGVRGWRQSGLTRRPARQVRGFLNPVWNCIKYHLWECYWNEICRFPAFFLSARRNKTKRKKRSFWKTGEARNCRNVVHKYFYVVSLTFRLMMAIKQGPCYHYRARPVRTTSVAWDEIEVMEASIFKLRQIHFIHAAA